MFWLGFQEVISNERKVKYQDCFKHNDQTQI